VQPHWFFPHFTDGPTSNEPNEINSINKINIHITKPSLKAVDVDAIRVAKTKSVHKQQSCPPLYLVKPPH
jgi:hypothetical protein